MELGSMVTLGTFLLANTGALIYFAGKVNETLRYHGSVLEDHNQRLNGHDSRCMQCEKKVAELNGKMELITQ